MAVVSTVVSVMAVATCISVSIAALMSLEVAAVISVSHAMSAIRLVSMMEVLSVIPASSAVHSPAVSTPVRYVEMWSSEVEIVTSWIS